MSERIQIDNATEVLDQAVADIHASEALAQQEAAKLAAEQEAARIEAVKAAAVKAWSDPVRDPKARKVATVDEVSVIVAQSQKNLGEKEARRPSINDVTTVEQLVPNLSASREVTIATTVATDAEAYLSGEGNTGLQLSPENHDANLRKLRKAVEAARANQHDTTELDKVIADQTEKRIVALVERKQRAKEEAEAKATAERKAPYERLRRRSKSLIRGHKGAKTEFEGKLTSEEHTTLTSTEASTEVTDDMTAAVESTAPITDPAQENAATKPENPATQSELAAKKEPATTATSKEASPEIDLKLVKGLTDSLRFALENYGSGSRYEVATIKQDFSERYGEANADAAVHELLADQAFTTYTDQDGLHIELKNALGSYTRLEGEIIDSEVPLTVSVGVASEAKNTPNEDTILNEVINGSRIVGVFDGMGGYASGELASRDAAEAVAQYFDTADLPQTITEANEQMQAAFLSATQKIQQSVDGRDTTAAVVRQFAVGDKQYATIGSAGDSRIVLFRDGILMNLSPDQSVGNEVYNSVGDPIPRHPNTYQTIQLKEGDAILVASDGITGDYREQKLSEREFREAFTSPDAELIAQAFLNVSRKSDDKSAVVLQVSQESNGTTKPEPSAAEAAAEDSNELDSAMVARTLEYVSAGDPDNGPFPTMSPESIAGRLGYTDEQASALHSVLRNLGVVANDSNRIIMGVAAQRKLAAAIRARAKRTNQGDTQPQPAASTPVVDTYIRDKTQERIDKAQAKASKKKAAEQTVVKPEGPITNRTDYPLPRDPMKLQRPVTAERLSRAQILELQKNRYSDPAADQKLGELYEQGVGIGQRLDEEDARKRAANQAAKDAERLKQANRPALVRKAAFQMSNAFRSDRLKSTVKTGKKLGRVITRRAPHDDKHAPEPEGHDEVLDKMGIK